MSSRLFRRCLRDAQEMFSGCLGDVEPMFKKDRELFSNYLAIVWGDVQMCLMYVEVVLGFVLANIQQTFKYFEVRLSHVQQIFSKWF